MRMNRYFVLLCLIILSLSFVGCKKQKDENKEISSLNESLEYENEENNIQEVRQYSEDELYDSLDSKKLEEIGLMRKFIMLERFITEKPRENDELPRDYDPKDRSFIKMWITLYHNVDDNTIKIKTYYNLQGMHSKLKEDKLVRDDSIFVGDCPTIKEVGEKLIKVMSRKDFLKTREDYTKDTNFDEVAEKSVEQQTNNKESVDDSEGDIGDEDYEEEDENVESSQNKENQEVVKAEPEYIKTSPEEIVKFLDKARLKENKVKLKGKFIYKGTPDYPLDGYYYYLAIDYNDSSYDQLMYLYRTRIKKIDKFMKVFDEEGYEPPEDGVLYNYKEVPYSILGCNSVEDIAKVIDNMIFSIFFEASDMENSSFVYKDYSVKEILSNLFKEDLINNNLYVDGESLKSVKPDWRQRTRRIDFRLDRTTGILSGDIYVLGGFKREDQIVHTENYDLSSFTEMEKVRFFIGDNMRNLTLYD